jgi:hypothetical protein
VKVIQIAVVKTLTICDVLLARCKLLVLTCARSPRLFDAGQRRWHMLLGNHTSGCVWQSTWHRLLCHCWWQTGRANERRNRAETSVAMPVWRRKCLSGVYQRTRLRSWTGERCNGFVLHRYVRHCAGKQYVRDTRFSTLTSLATQLFADLLWVATTHAIVLKCAMAKQRRVQSISSGIRAR